MNTPIRLPALLLPLLLATAPPAQVSDELALAIKTEGLERSQAMAILDHLTNQIGHRLTGSDNFTLACQWARSEFERMGLRAELEKWDTWPVVWNRGQWSGRVTSPVELELQVATPAWTAGTKGLVSGRLLPVPGDAEELEAIADRIEGAYLFGRKPGRRDEFRDQLMQFLVEHPIAGWVNSSRGDATYPNRIRVFGQRPRNALGLPTTPDIVVRNDQARQLRELLDGEQEVIVEFDIRNRFRAEPIDLHNVVAELPGTEHPEEVVVVCGHLDSWHQATGTTDNGTGTATTMEAARILAAVGARPKRTIRFCLWGGEEQGLLGSAKHTTMRRTQMDEVAAVFNHDTGTNWAQNLTVTEAQYDDMLAVFAPVMSMKAPDASWDGPVFELRKTKVLRGGGGSDHASFLRAGVPAFAWGLRGRSDYFRHTWHSQWDTFDVAIPEYQRHTATVIALAALGVANLPDKLSREGVQRARGSDLRPMIEGMLGLELKGEDGLEVASVAAGGRAARIGLLAGDLIVKADGQEITRLTQLRGALRGRGGDVETPEHTFTVRRGGTEVTLKFDLAKIMSGDGDREPAAAAADKETAGAGKKAP